MTEFEKLELCEKYLEEMRPICEKYLEEMEALDKKNEEELEALYETKIRVILKKYSEDIEALDKKCKEEKDALWKKNDGKKGTTWKECVDGTWKWEGYLEKVEALDKKFLGDRKEIDDKCQKEMDAARTAIEEKYKEQE